MPRIIRPIRIEGNDAFVTLTKGYVAVIDAADVHLFYGQNWGVFPRPGVTYATRGENGTTTYMHRIIMRPEKGFVVDHIDNDGLNNRRSNLRIVTQAENLWNSRVKRTSASGIKGVKWDAERGKWMARIRKHGRQHFLGRFPTMEDAQAAYAAASAELHGKYGRIS